MAHSKKKQTKASANSNPAQKKKTAQQERIVNICAIVLGICLIGIIVVIIARSSMTFTSNSGAPVETTSSAPTSLQSGDGATLDNAVATHLATIDIQNYGTIQLELYGNSAPATVANFVALANSGYYDGLTFHRIVEGFMMQGGAGASVDKIPGEFRANGFENNLLHKKGVISMARASAYDSASSQFFIMHADKTHLDGDYAAFGYVISGIEVVDKICTDAKPTDKNGSIAADKQPVITSIKVTELS